MIEQMRISALSSSGVEGSVGKAEEVRTYGVEATKVFEFGEDDSENTLSRPRARGDNFSSTLI